MMNRSHRRRGLAAWVLLGAIALSHPSHAATITGTVQNEAGAGLGNVDLDFIDLCSGDNIFLSGDKTAADGTYSVIVPNGTYDIHYTPPAGSTVAAADHQDQVVSTNVNLGITTLHPGRLVSGVVQTPSLGPAAGVDLKFVDHTTNSRVYLTKDVTNASGQYAVRVPPGTYDIDFRPPLTSAFTDKERFSLVVGGADVSGLVDVLGNGFIISGTVQDKHNNKLKNVDIDVFDACTGKRLATAHDNTDINGNYSVCVPAGTYTFNYDPPQCHPVEAARAPGTIVDRSKNFGTVQLNDAILVSGVVTTHTGQPLANAKILFFDATAAGTPRQAATHDHTDAAGAFSIYVPTGTYDINVEPPVGVLEQVGHLSSVGVGAATNVGTIQLAAGVAVSGHLSRPGSLPAANVNINAVDSATRVAQRLAHDATDDTGNFTVVVAPGTYDFQYDPPTCSGLAPTSQNARSIGGTTVLPALSLVTGVHVLGSVFDTHALPVPNVDLDFYPAGATTKSYTPNDRTAVDGTYDVVVPPGVYDIKYIPPSTTRFRPGARPGTSLLATQTLPTLFVADGWIVSGVVKDAATLAPIAGVNIEFYAPGAPTPLWTTHHVTAVDGSYRVAVDAGTWDMVYVPPLGSPFGVGVRQGVAVAADVALADQLLGSATTGVEPLLGAQRLSLSAPWPNPARNDLQFTLVAPRSGDVELSAWDVAGRRIATLWRGPAESAVTVRWNPARTSGARLPAGIYWVRLVDRTGAAAVRRVVLVH